VTDFSAPSDLIYNRGKVSDPEALRRAKADGTPFAHNEELEQWVAQGLQELSSS
jgi:hypothetical protein